jgi:DNA repair protein RadC
VVRPLLRSAAMCLFPSPALRPRERLCLGGPSDISDAELVALILGTGRPGTDAVALARELIDDAGSLTALARVPPAELAQHRGIGSARAARLAAAFALGRRALLHDRPAGAILTTPPDVHTYVWPRLAGLEHELFILIAMDIRNSVITDLEIARGTVNGVDVHPREVFRPLIRCGAAAAIVVHNHPSGDPTPSFEDIVLTERLHTVGSLIGIPVTDHIILTAHRSLSVAAWLSGRMSGT